MSDETQIVAPHTIAQIVKGTTAEFSHYKLGILFYTVDVEDFRYEFPISIVEEEIDYMLPENEGEDEIQIKTLKFSNDIGESSFERTYKAITLMRYIRKAISDGKIRWDKII